MNFKKFEFFSIFTAVSNKLRELSTTTDILSDNPTTLQEEVMRIVAAKSNSKKQNKNQRNESPS